VTSGRDKRDRCDNRKENDNDVDEIETCTRYTYTYL
jgi:hypothetical protein